jgi:prolyl 4-hydroxylase
MGLPASLSLPDRKIDVLIEMQHPRVVVVGSFLSDQECDALVEMAQSRLSRSETVDSDTGGSAIHGARTSEGMFFQRQETELIERIEKRIESFLEWPLERGEGIQVLRYRAGAEYRPHYDYFDESQPGVSRILSRGGQRVGTLVMYLNTPAQGGSTTFPDVGLSVLPVKGQAVFFGYPIANPDSLTLHGGAEVLKGIKWVATKWLRQSRFD